MTVQRLFDSPHLLDILLEFEDLLDGINLYAYGGWYDGEIYKGPLIKKYFIEVWLKYNNEPDKAGIPRLTDKKILVDVSKDKKDDSAIWVVKISVPKHLFGNMTINKYQDYEDEVDLENVESAVEDGIVNDGEHS